MAASKKLLEAVSKDPELGRQLDEAVGAALGALLKEKGLEAEAQAAAEAAMQEFAQAHGLETGEGDELEIEELDAVAGGRCVCPIGGGGKGTGKNCVCVIGGGGTNDSGSPCVCAAFGCGLDD